jgi:hypothetical protein
MAEPRAPPIFELYQSTLIYSLATATAPAFAISVKHVGRDDTHWWAEGGSLIDIKIALTFDCQQTVSGNQPQIPLRGARFERRRQAS